VITGDADVAHWPEQTYRVGSVVDFHCMREIFFAHENYTLSGEGRFNGSFHSTRTPRLTGGFTSEVVSTSAATTTGFQVLRASCRGC
jgi:hypothetical protein